MSYKIYVVLLKRDDAVEVLAAFTDKNEARMWCQDYIQMEPELDRGWREDEGVWNYEDGFDEGALYIIKTELKTYNGDPTKL